MNSGHCLVCSDVAKSEQLKHNLLRDKLHTRGLAYNKRGTYNATSVVQDKFHSITSPQAGPIRRVLMLKWKKLSGGNSTVAHRSNTSIYIPVQIYIFQYKYIYSSTNIYIPHLTFIFAFSTMENGNLKSLESQFRFVCPHFGYINSNCALRYL